MTDPAKDPQIVLAALARSHPVLELGTLDLCFLAALHLQAEGAALSAFSEEKLCEVFEQACALVEPRADNLKRRATHSIQRLRDQKLLARVDGAGVDRKSVV